MIKHNYALEIDVIEAAGIDAIQKLAEKGNVVYVPFEEMERRAQLREKDRYSQQFGATLDFISENGKKILKKNQFLMPMGGSVSWENVPENITHLTRDSAIKSKLKREGKEYEEPSFLKYGIQTLKEGFVDVEYSYSLNPKEITLDSLTNETGREFANNTIVRLNGNDSLIYKVEFSLIPNSDGTRFDLNEDEGMLKKIDIEEIKPLFAKTELRGLEQQLAYSLLLDNNIEFMIVSGGSGSGKTVISYIAAVEQILSKGKDKLGTFENILLFKSNDIIGGKDREQGFLPGTAYQKVKPFMKSYVDAHKLSGLSLLINFREMLADPRDEEDEFGKRLSSKVGEFYLPAREKAIEIEHLQYARGRTFENKLVIVDEAQNYTPYEIKQLIERVGVNSKILLIGDPEQLDNPRLTKDYNGLVYAANINYNTHPRFAMSHLSRNYRSQSAEIMRAKRAPKE